MCGTDLIALGLAPVIIITTIILVPKIFKNKKKIEVVQK
ncbi:hypothetical protein [Nitrosopumilus spindle-shaped virus]|uniref:Uncharacterized protein n=1 Tax=Nitrosopumilus spindle-shaped virus TaxID=2508184 RepID=A0A514K370_9VIRU|nr:hypothetical protein [Nitrosopumilus spindle-shaped virus]